ncbi:MAG: hypothetical protein IKU97_02365 [Tidjanibacter sp.]|nr:hypothetical protein [Tidjanibacter sp.]
MKNIWKIALMVAALMTSCNQPIEEDITPEQNSGNAINFYVGSDNRTTYFEGEGMGINWKAGDKLSVRRFDEANTDDGNTFTTRQRANFTVDNSGASSTLTMNSTWGDITWLEGQDTYIAAFYPQTNNGSIQKVGITLSSAQTQAAAGDHSHIGGLMWMKTEPMKFSAPYPSSVGLQFRNMYSIIELTIKGNQSNKQIASVQLTAANGLTINGTPTVDLYTSFEEDDANGIKNLKPANTLPNVTTTLTEPAALSAQGAKVYFVVLPGAHESGAITVTATATDGSTATATMDAVTFKANKVYRPAINLTFEEIEPAPAAAKIKHIFSETKGYGEPTTLKDGALVITDRTSYALSNVPLNLWGNQVATITATTYPEENRIVALTDGYVYMLTGSSELLTNENNIPEILLQDGWTAITPEANGSWKEDVTYEEDQVYYVNTSNGDKIGCFTIYAREMMEGEEYDFTVLYPYLKKFQGIRPIAAEITNEVIPAEVPAGATVYMDFSSAPAGWIVGNDTFANNLKNSSLKGKYSMPVESTLTDEIELDFSYVETDGVVTAGTHYNKSNFLLIYMNSTTVPLSVGFPAIAGHKLTAVELIPYSGASSSVKPKVCISSTAAPADAVSVSGAFVQWVHTSGNLTLNIENSQANTPYYLYALGGYSSVRLHGITLYYEPAN